VEGNSGETPRPSGILPKAVFEREYFMRHVFLILAAALIALPTFAEQKKPQQTPTPAGISGKYGKGIVMCRVISRSGNTFTVTSDGKELTFSGAKLKDLPKVGETIEITFTQAPGGPLEATTVKSIKSNSSDRIAGGDEGAGQTGQQQQDTRRKMTGRVLSQQGRTFTVIANGKEVTFSAETLKALPKVGSVIDITYTENPGGPLKAVTLDVSKSKSD
jgi:hypothetical protein